jgi:putative ABC transport system permease protein
MMAVIITVMLVILAAANTAFIIWATVVGARQPSALAHAFGATPRQVSVGLSAAQLLPALPGTIVGIPAGIYLYRAVTHDQITVPRPWQLLADGDPARRHRAHCHPSLGARRPPAEILQSE